MKYLNKLTKNQLITISKHLGFIDLYSNFEIKTIKDNILIYSYLDKKRKPKDLNNFKNKYMLSDFEIVSVNDAFTKTQVKKNNKEFQKFMIKYFGKSYKEDLIKFETEKQNSIINESLSF